MRVYNAKCNVCGGDDITTYLHHDPESGYVCFNCGEGVGVTKRNEAGHWPFEPNASISEPLKTTNEPSSARVLVGYRVKGKNSGVYITSDINGPFPCRGGAVPSSLHRAEAYTLAADFMKTGGDCVIVKVYLRTETNPGQGTQADVPLSR